MQRDQLYSHQDKLNMQAAEASRLSAQNRVDELILFARSLQTLRIGIANCIAFGSEALALREKLSDFGVFAINCKCGGIKKKMFLQYFKQ